MRGGGGEIWGGEGRGEGWEGGGVVAGRREGEGNLECNEGGGKEGQERLSFRK